MVQLIPQRAPKGTVAFKVVCDCGRDHDISVKPANITFKIDLKKKGKVLDHISVKPNIFTPKGLGV